MFKRSEMKILNKMNPPDVNEDSSTKDETKDESLDV